MDRNNKSFKNKSTSLKRKKETEPEARSNKKIKLVRNFRGQTENKSSKIDKNESPSKLITENSCVEKNPEKENSGKQENVDTNKILEKKRMISIKSVEKINSEHSDDTNCPKSNRNLMRDTNTKKICFQEIIIVPARGCNVKKNNKPIIKSNIKLTRSPGSRNCSIGTKPIITKTVMLNKNSVNVKKSANGSEKKSKNDNDIETIYCKPIKKCSIKLEKIDIPENYNDIIVLGSKINFSYLPKVKTEPIEDTNTSNENKSSTPPIKIKSENIDISEPSIVNSNFSKSEITPPNVGLVSAFNKDKSLAVFDKNKSNSNANKSTVISCGLKDLKKSSKNLRLNLSPADYEDFKRSPGKFLKKLNIKVSRLNARLVSSKSFKNESKINQKCIDGIKKKLLEWEENKAKLPVSPLSGKLTNIF